MVCFRVAAIIQVDQKLGPQRLKLARVKNTCISLFAWPQQLPYWEVTLAVTINYIAFCVSWNQSTKNIYLLAEFRFPKEYVLVYIRPFKASNLSLWCSVRSMTSQPNVTKKARVAEKDSNMRFGLKGLCSGLQVASKCVQCAETMPLSTHTKYKSPERSRRPIMNP